ncbi:non-ribosomal peptide synthetase [Legionella sp.]|uniref:non-ribosomal peptide synthetase n=1 Tax=Legionella sp. TaxID=459 RepID=UPI000CC7A4F5|nr:non-ribosomal peptide synthetase [Legionella sp.]PJE06926.1 MAG: non-ribosomal peptide synthetase [Legionella sp.]
MIKKRLRENTQTLVEMFECQAALRPQAIAISCANQTISYGELNQKVNQLAHSLSQLGVKKELPVAICMERSIDLIIGILGILKAGGAYVPLDQSNPAERLLYILNRDYIPILITTPEMAVKFRGYQGTLLPFSDKDFFSEPKQEIANQKSKISPNQLAYIIYTSGSTGPPKGVLIEHRSIVNYSKWIAELYCFRPEERIDFSSNISFDFSLTTSIIPLTQGLTIVICEDKVKKDPNLYLDYLETNKISYVKLTPAYFEVLLQQAKFQNTPLNYLKKIILGGEALLSIDCASWLNLYPNHILFNEYGPTETTVGVSVYQIDRNNIAQLGTYVPIGELFPNCNFYLVNQGNRVGKNEVGELYVGGVCLARGYLNHSQLTAEKFISNTFDSSSNTRLYKTGDLCRQLTNSKLEYIGRIDNQIKIRGYRIEPAEIESILTKHSALESAKINAVENYRKEKILVAYYILNNKKAVISDGELRQYLKGYLPDFMIPTFFIAMESFPLNENDKLNLKALPIPRVFSHEEPQSPLEKTIAEIWSNELGLDPIGINDDFFELGGHSLSAARIISALTQLINKNISIRQFYQNPTIRALSILLDKQQKINNRIHFPGKIYQDNYQSPLSDFQFTLWLATIFEPKAKKINICGRKRFYACLNEKKLRDSFENLLKKHDALSYKIAKFIPEQQFKKSLTIKIEVIYLESLSLENETILEKSLEDLRNDHYWPKNYALFRARIFYLPGDKTELQFCMPHIISDEVSIDILFSDLSQLYLSEELPNLQKDNSHREYIFAEQQHLNTHFDHDLIFWQNYLNNTALLVIPDDYVVPNMKKQKLAYSSHIEIPENLLDALQIYCSKHHFSLDLGLCGVLLLALNRILGESNSNSALCFSKVKSTRDNCKYDNTIGCFLSLDLIKVMLNKEENLNSLCQQLRASIISTSPFQKCPNLAKLACISNFRHSSRVKEIAVNGLTSIYNFVVPSHPLNHKLINHCVRLNKFKGNHFLINVNVYKDFVNTKNRDNSLFESECEPLANNWHDLLAINNFLDVCFLRMEDQKAYMVVSANLTTEFKALLGKELLEICKLLQ